MGRAQLKKETCKLDSAGNASVCCREDPAQIDRCLRCGIVQTFNDLRCIGCESSLPGDWPWMARLLYKDQNPKLTKCGGVLVSFLHVITAAHCVDEQGPDRVVLGENDVTTEYDCRTDDCGQMAGSLQCLEAELCADRAVTIQVEDVTKHPDYRQDSTIPDMDIAVIKLKTFARFTAFIQPICLPQLDQEKPFPLAGEPLIVSGWGNTHSWSLKPSKILQFLSVFEVPREECAKTWERNISSSVLCVSSRKSGQSPCVGDSGGPLVRLVDSKLNKYELAGIVSFGPTTCGNAEFPIGTTKLDGAILSWVTDMVTGTLLPV